MRDKADYLLQGRVRIIKYSSYLFSQCILIMLMFLSVWKPLKHVVEDYPLAVCDSSSMFEDDLIECDHIRKRFTGATFYAHFNPEQKWYYLSQQRPDEALLLKIFDSEDSVKGKRESTRDHSDWVLLIQCSRVSTFCFQTSKISKRTAVAEKY